MAVSEMQIEHRLRPVIAEMERGLFKVVDALQKETTGRSDVPGSGRISGTV